jgi:hypothetical protein
MDLRQGLEALKRGSAQRASVSCNCLSPMDLQRPYRVTGSGISRMFLLEFDGTETIFLRFRRRAENTARFFFNFVRLQVNWKMP